MEAVVLLRILAELLLLLQVVQHTESVRCFARFNAELGKCEEEFAVDLDDEVCCQNPLYGFHDEDGVCRSCGPATWTSWSSWSYCNSLCGGGVMQRHRECFGFGECDGSQDTLQTKPCTGSCCDAKGWADWSPWTPCSVTCGEGGERQRTRLCPGPSKCRAACSGEPRETEKCPPTTCPVHGGWSSWSVWSQCSGSCVFITSDNILTPVRTRERSCSDPAPSSHTVPPGDRCPGNNIQEQDCSELPNCPINGAWGSWAPMGQCSVKCGAGLQLWTRLCDDPPPKYGGSFCEGQGSKAEPCQITCPVDGLWSGWSSWTECSVSCVHSGQKATRRRYRQCSSPPPSSHPPGRDCGGPTTETVVCGQVPPCPVSGGWGSWSAYSSCSVTCGAGLKESIRTCDRPVPQHGGAPCPGDARRTQVCATDVYCPVNGVWSQWSSWETCNNPFTPNIRCRRQGGLQSRERRCLYKAHGGENCQGPLSDSRGCYNVTDCQVASSWSSWESWSLCSPPCGNPSQRTRSKQCLGDFSSYSKTIGRDRKPATFAGTPDVTCDPLPEGEIQETETCLNVPACT